MIPIRFMSRFLLPFLLLLAAELTYTGSNSAQSIRMGMLVAMEEVNQAGGVLGGRPARSRV